MVTQAVTIPPSLAFLVSNFNSLVNIKLDNSNYCLWKIQVENVVSANGFLGYLDGTIVCPATKIRSVNGKMTPNPAFASWKLIDSQLLPCLTASLSQNTLPYVLGLRHSYQVWSSLNEWYNSLPENYVHDLREKTYFLKKGTTTMEAYLDSIKEIAQKLEAVGHLMEESELIFHTLWGLTKGFRGFKTALRTWGLSTIRFPELVTMLKGEDMYMIHDDEDSSIVDSTSVLFPLLKAPVQLMRLVRIVLLHLIWFLWCLHNLNLFLTKLSLMYLSNHNPSFILLNSLHKILLEDFKKEDLAKDLDILENPVCRHPTLVIRNA